jgi:membrane protein implicated in regulation of membrane protease activity
MQTLYDLYLQNPFWIWLAVGAIFVALDIVSGAGKLIWPAVAAAALAFINLADVRLGLSLEIGVFLAVSIVGLALAFGLNKRKPHASPDEALTERRTPSAEELAVANADRTGRLIGRIGRTTGEFINGVGRVWIDGVEWGAEIEGADELPPDAPVRVMGVCGGVRLRVQGLMTG